MERDSIFDLRVGEVYLEVEKVIQNNSTNLKDYISPLYEWERLLTVTVRKVQNTVLEEAS
jgi:hypothetical protein